MMTPINLKTHHSSEKPVSALPLFQGEGVATSLQILKNQKLKEHLTKIPALLLCVTGEVVFEDENGGKHTLQSGDYLAIEPMVRHWVVGTVDSQLVLLK